MIEIRVSAVLAVFGLARIDDVALTRRVRSRRPRAAAFRPRRVVARTMAFGLGAIAAAAFVIATPQQTSGWNQGSAEATLWQLLNGSRENNGRAPLQPHEVLVSLARWRSSDMLANDYFSHTIAGCGCLVYAYYDQNGLAYDWAGENIGWNSGLDDSDSPVSVHEQFMASPGHRANVLDPRFTHGAVGAAAADAQMFQGYVQNTRMYTELFLQPPVAAAPYSVPAPPTTGGPGAGGGFTQPAITVAQAPAPPAEPSPFEMSVAIPQRPTSTAGIDGVTTLVAAGPIPGRSTFQSTDSSYGHRHVPRVSERRS